MGCLQLFSLPVDQLVKPQKNKTAKRPTATTTTTTVRSLSRLCQQNEEEEALLLDATPYTLTHPATHRSRHHWFLICLVSTEVKVSQVKPKWKTIKKHLQFAIAFPIELIKANDRLLPAAIAALDTCENFRMNWNYYQASTVASEFENTLEIKLILFESRSRIETLLSSHYLEFLLGIRVYHLMLRRYLPIHIYIHTDSHVNKDTVSLGLRDHYFLFTQ